MPSYCVQLKKILTCEGHVFDQDKHFAYLKYLSQYSNLDSISLKMSISHSRGLNEAGRPGGLTNKKDGVFRRTSQGLKSVFIHLRMFNLKMSTAGDLAIPFKVLML